MNARLAVSENVGIELSSRLVSKQVLSPQQSLTSVFGMGTGGPSALKIPTSSLFARSELFEFNIRNELSSRLVSKQVLSPQQSLTSVFGMGTGGPSALKSRIVFSLKLKEEESL